MHHTEWNGSNGWIGQVQRGMERSLEFEAIGKKRQMAGRRHAEE